MLRGYDQAVIRQSRELMVVLGYIMAYAAFFVVLAEYGEITLGLRIVQWVFLAIPMAYVVGVTVRSINQARGS